jgi:lysine 2,3-aminomutase
MANHQLNATHRRTIRRSEDLLETGLIGDEQIAEIDAVCAEFSMAITPEMADLIDSTDQADPIARQFVPTAAELNVLPVERADPIGDDPFTKVKGITHRYPDRLLLKPLHVCAVYCRFCFRREKVGPGSELLSDADLDAALDYVRAHPEVWEVILTGGDPLVLSERRLAYIIKALDEIEHVEVIRIHTRIPTVDPKRITPGIVQALKVNTPVYVVLHCNHPREMTEDARRACAALVDNGIPMLSQSVLLKGVNDDPTTLSQLMRAFIRARVKPYYLHHGDLAEGTSHFRTTIEEGQALMRAIRGHVSGICQPTYVLDIPGGYGKAPIGPNYLSSDPENNRHIVEDYQGNRHCYPPQIDNT